MATGQGLIEDALRDIGVGALGDTPNQEIINYSLRQLNRMLETWSAEVGPQFYSVFESLTWTSGQASQTIGSGGDLNTTRPISITSLQTRKSSLDYTLNQVSLEQYQTTVLKSISTDYPEVFAYQRNFPLGTIYMFPVPASSLSIRITSKKALSDLTLAGTVALPEGYEEAIQKNLAIRLAPAFGRSVKPELVMVANKAKEAIKMVNRDHNEMWPDYMLPGQSDGENIDILTNS